MRVYIASFFDTRARLYPIRAMLREMGYVVTSTWLDETPSVAEEDMVSYFASCAQRDWEDLRSSDLLIIDTSDETPRGGREVELGLALAWRKKVFRVGPPRNVFHYFLRGFKTWDDMLAYLKSYDAAPN